MRRLLFHAILAGAGLLTRPLPVWSADRPLVGLALSGGGARGFAHIGVLRVLEQEGIPIDIVAGTSMGSVIGGLYAAGNDPDELERIVAGIAWDQLLTREVERDLQLITQKRRGRIHQGELVIRGGEISLPEALRATQRAGNLFSQLTLGASYRSGFQFDRLPVRYRAVAADFETGQEVVFSSGSLGDAMLASMSLPGIFPPVRVDGRVLADGGLVKNIPVDVAKAAGAAVVIAVDIGTPPRREADLSGLQDYLAQSIVLMSLEADRRQKAMADVVIVPDLGGHTLLDFSGRAQLIAQGETAARAALPAIRAALAAKGIDAGAEARALAAEPVRTIREVRVTGLADPAVGEAWAAQTRGRSLTERSVQKVFLASCAAEGHPLVAVDRLAWDESTGRLTVSAREARVGNIIFTGNQKTREWVLRRELSIRAGDPVHLPTLEQDVQRLWATGLFEAVSARMEPESARAGTVALKVRVREKPPGRLRLGMHWSQVISREGPLEGAIPHNVFGWNQDVARLTLLGELAHENVFGTGAAWSLEAHGGSAERFATELSVPRFLNSPFTASAGAGLDRRDREARIGPGRSTQYTEQRRGFPIRVGFESRLGQLALGYRWEEIRLFDVSPALAAQAGAATVEPVRVAAVRGESLYDSLNRFPFPDRGARRRVDVELAGPAVGSDARFGSLSFDWLWVQSFAARHTVSVGVGLGFSMGDVPFAELPRLGGMDSIVGYFDGELFARNTQRLNLSYRQRLDWIARSLGKLYLTLHLDSGNRFDFVEELDQKKAGVSSTVGGVGAGLAYDSLIGPVRLVVGRNDAAETRFYATVGYALR